MTNQPIAREEPPLVRLAQQVEADSRLDGYADLLRAAGQRLIASPASREALQGQWFGHALHPLLTDVPLGMWLAATTLDLVGGPDARPAARRLLTIGLVAAVPTAVTGLAEVAPLARRERRVGAVHASANSVGLTLYTASLLARRRGRQRLGVTLALAGGLAATVGGYFGGHLTEARKVSSRHPAFDEPGSVAPAG